MATHAATRITDPDGVVRAYSYRDTIIDHWPDGTWGVVGFGPEFSTEYRTLADAKAYIDSVKDG